MHVSEARASQVVVTNMIRVMKECGWSYQGLINTPIPAFFMVLDQLVSDSKEQEKSFKKKK